MAGIGFFESGIEVGKDHVCKEIKVENPVGGEFGMLGSFGCLIEEEMERGVIGNDVKSGEVVSVDRDVARSGGVRSIDGSGLKGREIESDEDESDSESDSESASSSSSLSSSTTSSSSEDDDADEEEEEEEGEEEKKRKGRER
ncbi:unnamed protein product [Ilex paraguariensis]|uniref:Uncharacterized protein n=1 Tax=Ilex paraguariensis TaxID=185542 RepID=A0ABC8UV00_9AQUA